MTFPPASALLLLPATLLCLDLGQRFRRTRNVAPESPAIEGALFALFGLLLAFTFSGAIARFDDHRHLLVQETNAIGTAYLRLDLLPATTQPSLRQLFRDYTTSRLHLFDSPGVPAISPESTRLQLQIWQQAVAAAGSPGASPDAAKLLIPALNDMIDITATRSNAFNLHPPAIVFLLLFILSCACAFIAGHSMNAPRRNWFHTLVFALTITLTVYTTLDIEYPRQGLIHLRNPDALFQDLRDSMN